MLKRKIEKELITWKEDSKHKPLIIKGCRQCGKTYSVLDFANKNYKSVIYINFFANESYKEIFSESLEVDSLIINISAYFGEKAKIIPNETVLIFDEIQECPRARASLKFFYLDGRFDVIATGSLLGIHGYNDSAASIPVGYETMKEMKPLDFEEFLWANGITENTIDELSKCFNSLLPVPKALHERMNELLLRYVIVGGMPEVVNTFLNTKNLYEVLKIQKDIINDYEEDMLKYADSRDKSKIRQCFQSIPKQLAKENKKFQYSVIRKGSTASDFFGSLQWIEDAGIIKRCYNLSALELPLEGNAINEVFKVYMQDTGLFVSMLEEGTQFDILRGNLYSYKGAIFENLIADFFCKMGRSLYYYHKDSGLEIDFVTRYKGECVLIEVKASSGNIKSSKTILSHPEKYHVSKVIKLGNYNVGKKDQTITMPTYMGFLLTDY